MRNLSAKFGNWALIAGAAEGLGAAYARELAAQKMNLLLVDIKEEELESLKSKLSQKYGIEIKTLLADLSDFNSIAQIITFWRSVECRLLIYNAAYGPVRPFLANTPEQLDYHLEVNCRTPMHLCYQFCRQYAGKQAAGIILMSSFAGIWGTNLVAPYGATKAFDYNLGKPCIMSLPTRV